MGFRGVLWEGISERDSAEGPGGLRINMESLLASVSGSGMGPKDASASSEEVDSMPKQGLNSI